MSSNIRFAHLADLHLGAYREKKLTNLNLETFREAIKKVIELKVDFCLFAGDIFNSSMPPLELVNSVVVELMKLKKNNIPLYVIGGSHDYSNSGKSFIHLLENAGVFIDVCKYEQTDKGKVKLQFTKDPNTKTVISGILGKKRGLDRNIYTNLNENNLSKDNFNLFMFHSTLDDFKPDFMSAIKANVDSSFLPKGFDYYAAGHVHTYIEGNIGSGKMSFPGPLFPNNFSELKREKPSFNLCEFNFENREVKITRQFIKTYDKVVMEFDVDKKNPIEIRNLVIEKLNKTEVKDKILLIELRGVVEGKISDIGINEIVSRGFELGAYYILKNTYKLTSSKLQDKVKIDNYDSVEQIEKQIIEESLKDLTGEDKKKSEEMMENLLSLNLSKMEEEKVAKYEERVTEALRKVMKI